VKPSSKKIWRSFLLALFLSHYLAVGFVAYIGHNHEDDFNFHDNCPACQWHVQSQDDFSESKAILDALDNPLNFIGYRPSNSIFLFNEQDPFFSYLSRAPPST
jgi:hypothetical protein